MHRNEAIKSEGVKASVPDTIEGTGMGKKQSMRSVLKKASLLTMS